MLDEGKLEDGNSDEEGDDASKKPPAAEEGEDNGERPAKKRRVDPSPFSKHFERFQTFHTVPADLMARLSSFRLSAASLAKVRALFASYEGTLQYHNFTPGGRSSDKSTFRYMRRVTVDDPVVFPVPTSSTASTRRSSRSDADIAVRYPHGLECVRIELDGQSFMLNQIRKMIGAVASLMITGRPEAMAQELLNKELQRGIPMVPANGLFCPH